MNQMLTYAVLGSGHGGRAVCAQIAAKEYPVIMYEPLAETGDYLKIKAGKEMFIKGDMTAGGRLSGATMDIGEAVENAAVILIVVPSFAHQPIFDRLVPHLKDHQHIIIIPGNYGGLRLKKMMFDQGMEKNITISETASLPYACRIVSYNTVLIYKKKYRLDIASSPGEKNAEAIDMMNDLFSGYVKFTRAGHLLEMDLDNPNQTLHPLPVLLNYGDIEKHPDTFRHYMDGITPYISDLMMRMDAERLGIGKALGLQLTPVLEQLKMYYGGNDAKTVYEYVNSPESPYTDIIGHHVKSRYLTEDVPGLNVPALQLAGKVDLAAPATETTVRLTSLLHDVDYVSTGTTLDKLGIDHLSPEEIVALTA